MDGDRRTALNILGGLAANRVYVLHELGIKLLSTGIIVVM